MKADKPHILFVNPWIHDFAAYDFWAKPLGLLTLAALARRRDISVSYIDCLDRFHPHAPQTDPQARFGRGPYLKTSIDKPPGLADVPRRYSRYGIQPQWLREDLSALTEPDLICVTSLMTYWYPGVRECIGVIREVFPKTRIVLGGIYATLCRRHAMDHCGADLVVSGTADEANLELIFQAFDRLTGPESVPTDLDAYPYPAFDLQRRIPYVSLLTAKGCPFNCPYCASRYLQPSHQRRSADAVVAEIEYWYGSHGVRDFVFYDDALLVDEQDHALPMLEGIIRAGLPIRFHTPNALHIRGISAQNARLMAAAGFETIRLGLETIAFEERNSIDRKVTADEFLSGDFFFESSRFQAATDRRLSIGRFAATDAPVDCRCHPNGQAERRYTRAGLLFSYSAYVPVATGRCRFALSPR